MIYKEYKDLKLSALGMGAMRLPVIDGKDAAIDVEAAKKMVDYAMEKGVNYFDTAWGYHEGNSELVMGEALKKYPRESFYLATKFPGYDLNNMPKVEEIFEKQLEKCQVEYFDFYLFHNVCSMNINEYLDPQYGIFDYLMKQKENGRIKHLGVSFHGDVDVMTRFLEKYGHAMEFGQLQLNWLDWKFQDAKEKMELLQKYNIPIWVMEPLRGGMLVNLEGEYIEKLKELRPDETLPGWSFRFLEALPDVRVVLSGMSNFQQMAQNVDIFETSDPLNETEIQALLEIAESMTSKIAVPCTSCRYCTTHCPQGLDIPMLLGLYNEHAFTGGGFLAPMALQAVDEDKKPASCIGCHKCEQVCPQEIKIADTMKDFCEKLK